ncbi:hypothetical protein [Longitalea luteola]|uniref:hypothetical protein n=1 Tax=Longitalea luteola TaxID=2812563 RepID=UPI001A95E37E|nr:hypothetical protein [Longitalea luteola]
MTIQDFSSKSLVAEEAPHSKPVDVTFTFIGGIGQATAVLFRKGVLINMQSISNTGSVSFSEVQTSDVISVNGVCTGKAEVTVSEPTTPVSPKTFKAGLMMANFLIK